MQESVLREYALGASGPLSKRICRSIKQDGTYTCRVSKTPGQCTMNTKRKPQGRSCVHPITHILQVRVRVMLKIS
jgi:hypothetical protein